MISETAKSPESAAPSGESVSHRPFTGEKLRLRGIISDPQLQQALAHQEERGGHVGEILFGLTGGETVEICETVAEVLGVSWVRPDRMEIPDEVLGTVPARLATHYCIIPLAVEGKSLRIATSEPQDLQRLDEIELLIGRRVLPALAMTDHISHAIKKHYGVGAETIEHMHSLDADALVLDDGREHALDDDSGDASIIRFVNQVIVDAHRLDATDIHFEPEENAFRIRYRVDGLLEEVAVPTHIKRYQSAILSRIKVMARLNIAEQRLPQDGRIQVRLGDETFDLRVSVLPTPLGEAVDLRLLRRANVHLELEELGYSPENLRKLSSAASRPNGIILVTGPTGSGKTTTLYALLQKINTVDRKTITIEDPIEYQLPGMVQMQVHEQIGFTFARALRSILRHDPDIVLVGEIRDSETAEIAVRMAMTGHLVFSTLHTNDAASTIARLVDMGQEPYLLASTILCVVAQRLIRLLCPHCRASYAPDPATLEPFREMGLRMPDRFPHGQGCERCRKSGYLGRTGIHEVYPIDEDFRELIMLRSPASKFRETARRKKIPFMHEDAWLHVLAGETTLDEILRVTQAIET
jgi:general secretion pathway protein E